jgi:hypothetical protein
MPNQRLGGDDVAALLDYLEAQTAMSAEKASVNGVAETTLSHRDAPFAPPPPTARNVRQ